MEDELLDIVDENDIVIGTQLRSVVIIENRSSCRAIYGFIRNSKGDLWIPKRTAHKTSFPSCLDASVAGCVQAGEGYENGFIRELEEELNIRAQDVSYSCIAQLKPHLHGISVFAHIYEILSEQAPVYNPDDFVDYEWISPKDLREKLKQGTPAKPDLIKLITLLYS